MNGRSRLNPTPAQFDSGLTDPVIVEPAARAAGVTRWCFRMVDPRAHGWHQSLLLNSLDHRIRSRADVEHIANGVPVLAVLGSGGVEASAYSNLAARVAAGRGVGHAAFIAGSDDNCLRVLPSHCGRPAIPTCTTTSAQWWNRKRLSEFRAAGTVTDAEFASVVPYRSSDQCRWSVSCCGMCRAMISPGPDALACQPLSDRRADSSPGIGSIGAGTMRRRLRRLASGASQTAATAKPSQRARSWSVMCTAIGGRAQAMAATMSHTAALVASRPARDTPSTTPHAWRHGRIGHEEYQGRVQRRTVDVQAECGERNEGYKPNDLRDSATSATEPRERRGREDRPTPRKRSPTSCHSRMETVGAKSLR